MTDLTQSLQEWPWRPGKLDVRRFQGVDGRVLIQVRVELGILQMEADGPPAGVDGSEVQPEVTPMQPVAASNRETQSLLDLNAVTQLASVMSQRRQRGLACAMLEDWMRARRDAEDNVRALDLVAARAADVGDRKRFEPWRPHELAMIARADAAMAIASGRRDLAKAALENGLLRVHGSLQKQGQSHQAEASPESTLLRALLDAITLKLPASQRVELERRLQQAVLAENYELAAILRDELRIMEGSP